MTRDEAMQLARTVSRKCYRRWRVSENWEAVDIDSIVDEFLAEPPAPDVQGADKLGGNSDVQAQIDAAREEERDEIIDAIGGLDGPADYRRAMWDVLRIIATRSGARGAS